MNIFVQENVVKFSNNSWKIFQQQVKYIEVFSHRSQLGLRMNSDALEAKTKFHLAIGEQFHIYYQI